MKKACTSPSIPQIAEAISALKILKFAIREAESALEFEMVFQELERILKTLEWLE